METNFVFYGWRERKKKMIYLCICFIFKKLKSNTKSQKANMLFNHIIFTFHITSTFTLSHITFNKVTCCQVTSLKVTIDLTHDVTNDLTLDVTCVPRSNSKYECARNHTRARVR